MISLIPYDALTMLQSAERTKQVSAGAPMAQQLNAVAYAINTAANTGEYKALYNGQLSTEVVDYLENQGYTVALKAESVHPETVISWA